MDLLRLSLDDLGLVERVNSVTHAARARASKRMCACPKTPDASLPDPLYPQIVNVHHAARFQLGVNGWM